MSGQATLTGGRGIMCNEADLRFIEGTPEHDYAVEQATISDKSKCAGSVSKFKDLFSDIKKTKDPLADPNCASCKGRGFYHVLDVGEYDEQQTTVQCACKRKPNKDIGGKL